MKLYVLSDIHDNVWALERALKEMDSNNNHLLFLGDFCAPFTLVQLAEEFSGPIHVVWGNNEERNLANQIKENSPKVHICNKLSIGSLINLISEVNLVIGPDTGPTHMAWALNVPSIMLFGPTPGFRNSYQTSINRIIESKSNVNPLKIKKDDFSIEEISPREILKVYQDLFNL